MNFTKIMFGVLLAAILGSSIFLAFAGDINVQLQIPIAGVEKITTCNEKSDGTRNPDGTENKKLECTGLSEYVVIIYQWLVAAAAILAAVMFTVGGFQWLSAAGESKRVETGKKTMHNALVGLVLALGSYTLLAAINPDLVKFKGFDLSLIKPKAVILTDGTAGDEDADDEPDGGTFDSSVGVAVNSFTALKFRRGDVQKDIEEGGILQPDLIEILRRIDTIAQGSGKSYLVSRLNRGHKIHTMTRRGPVYSRHKYGEAADISGATPDDLATLANVLVVTANTLNIRQLIFCHSSVALNITEGHTVPSDRFPVAGTKLCNDHKTHIHISTKATGTLKTFPGDPDGRPGY